LFRVDGTGVPFSFARCGIPAEATTEKWVEGVVALLNVRFRRLTGWPPRFTIALPVILADFDEGRKRVDR